MTRGRPASGGAAGSGAARPGAALPRELAIFPLTGALLLPRGVLPLNIFEPRYLAMVDASLAADRLIGMVQPLVPEDEDDAPPVYAVGCAGRLTSFEETEDGRYLITLTGVGRFRIAEERPLDAGGFRRVAADWAPFADDLVPPAETPAGLDRARLRPALVAYLRQRGITCNWNAIDETPDERLVTSLSMICPFEPSEKQALLEAPTLAERAQLMTALIEMAAVVTPGPDGRQ